MANNFEAFLKARGKNHAEEVRLQQTLSLYELEKRQWERRVFNETYEQRKRAYSLKRESDEVTKKKKGTKGKKKKGGKYELDEAIDEVDGGYSQLPQLHRNYSHASHLGKSLDNFDSILSFPAVEQAKVHIVTAKKTSSPAELPQLTSERKIKGKIQTGGQIIITGSDGQQQHKFAAVVEAVIAARKGEEKAATPGGQLTLPLNPTRSLNTPRRPDDREKSEPTNKKVILSGVVKRLFPRNLRRARSMAALEVLKEHSLPRGMLLGRTMSGKVMEQEAEGDPEIDPSTTQTVYWVGDPKAIGSVRRSRLPPEMMCARSKNVGEVMKLIRDLPVYPSCSKNCNKPGATFEEVPGEQQTMLPSLVIANVARHYLKNSRASSLETLHRALSTQVVSFPAVQDSKFAAPTVQQQIERSMEEQRQSLRRAQREITKKIKA